MSISYLLTLLMAARGSSPVSSESPTDRDNDSFRLIVLIPAHNEQSGIRATLDSLAMCDYPSYARRIIVIADNCTDSTANCVREAGVEVWEREDLARRGKGFALAWALEKLPAENSVFDAVVVVDADCTVSPNILSAISRRLRSGTSALQVDYRVANAAASHAAALRFGGFALMNNVRFLGKQQLGMSCGLVGTGMAFTKDLLTRQPWTATGLIEDAEYHMRLVQTGERTEFVGDAWVSSATPTSLRGSSDQQARWEQGKLHLIRHWCPRLLYAGIVKRDVVRVHAGLEWLVPPQSLIAAGSVVSAFAGVLLGSRRLVLLSLSTLVSQLTFVLAGLRLVGAPAQVYRSLLIAPALIVRKVALYVKLLGGRGPTSWVRTEREATSPTAASR